MMKKLIKALLSLILVLSIGGCASKTFDTGMGLKITLPKEFAADRGEGYDFAFSNELSLKDSSLEEYKEKTIIITGLRDSFSDLRESEPGIGEDQRTN